MQLSQVRPGHQVRQAEQPPTHPPNPASRRRGLPPPSGSATRRTSRAPRRRAHCRPGRSPGSVRPRPPKAARAALPRCRPAIVDRNAAHLVTNPRRRRGSGHTHQARSRRSRPNFRPTPRGGQFMPTPRWPTRTTPGGQATQPVHHPQTVSTAPAQPGLRARHSATRPTPHDGAGCLCGDKRLARYSVIARPRQPPFNIPVPGTAKRRNPGSAHNRASHGAGETK